MREGTLAQLTKPATELVRISQSKTEDLGQEYERRMAEQVIRTYAHTERQIDGAGRDRTGRDGTGQDGTEYTHVCIS